MTKPPNPITIGLRTVLRDPVIYLVEILWRWIFALLTLLLLVAVGVVMLGPLPIMQRWPAIWNSRDPQLIGSFLATLVLLLGRKVIIAAIVVPIAIVLIWTLLSAVGRNITVKRLRRAETTQRFRSILALQLLRGFFFWISVILLLAAVLGEALIATRGSSPNLGFYYIMLTPSILIISVFWLAENWYLTLATIFGRQGQTFRGAFRQARQTVARQRSDFAGTGFVFLLMRIVLLLIALVICGLTSKIAGTAPQFYSTLIIVVAAIYFVVSDFLYMARMASYLALAAAHVEPGGPKLVQSAANSPAENSPAG